MKKEQNLEERTRDRPNQKMPQRMTIKLPESLDWYLDLNALETQRAKGKIIRESIASYLTACGYERIDEIPATAEVSISTQPTQSEDIKRIVSARATKRTTIFMTESLDWFLNFHALATRRRKNDIIKEAIALYLSEQGYRDLERIPSNVTIRYRA